ncbi:MAG: tetratricopeptide repeat protein [Acidobacteriota bacterium]
MRVSRVSTTVGALFATFIVLLAVSPATGEKGGANEVPITTRSGEARQEYLRGRALLEKLRATDARTHYAKAVELDAAFALAHFGMANTAPTASEFFAALRQAAAHAEQASEGEAHLIRAFEAGVNGQADAQRQHLAALVKSFPGDERVHNLVGNFFFGRQEWLPAITEYRKAIAIDPAFSQPYNQLGYALRFLERYDEAEQVFKKYVELISDEPNPYDSYAELLMKMGRFTDSITQYEKALEIQPSFVASYVGIANDQIFMGQPQEARKTLTRLEKIVRNDGERRQVCTWAAISYLHEGDAKSALGEVERCFEIAKNANDRTTMSGDLNFMANIQLEAGQGEAALASFNESVAAVEAGDATPEVKETARRNHLFDRARVELLRNDVAPAEATAMEYRQQVEAKKLPFELRQSAELLGLVALSKGDHKAAARELERANQQNPRVLFELGLAYAAAGRAEPARRAFERAATFNGLNVNYAYVRAKALAKLRS